MPSAFDRKSPRGAQTHGACSALPAWSPAFCRSDRACGRSHGRLRLYRPAPGLGLERSHAVAAVALRGVPNVGVVQADYLPESTNYGSGKDDPETQSLHQGDGGPDRRRRRRPRHFDVVRRRSFPAGDGEEISRCRVPPGLGSFANSANPPNVGSQNALINQGHYVNGVAAGLCTTTNKLGFVAGMPFGSRAAQREFISSRQPPDQSRCNGAGHLHRRVGGCRRTTPRRRTQLVDAGCDVITCHLDAPRVVIETAERRGVKTCGHAFDQAPLAPKGYITGAEYNWTEMFETFVETLQKGGTAAQLRHRRIRQGLCPLEPVRSGSDAGGDQRRNDRNASDEERRRNFRRSDQGQHRQEGGAGRNDLRPLCRRTSADRLSDRRRHRLDRLIAKS